MISSETEQRQQRSSSSDQPQDGGEEGGWFERYGIRHVAIIPDGNRRWATERGLTTLEGHSMGLLEVLPQLLVGMSQAGVHTQTFWGFSTENWTRQAGEVEYLMQIFGDFLEKHILGLAERFGAKLVHLGRIDRLPQRVHDLVLYVTDKTRANTNHVYNFALDYGGQDELNRAARRMARAAAEGGKPLDELDLEAFLDTRGQPYPNPDVLVRSSGEVRMSGFLPLQSAYSEFFFIERPFPDFDMKLLGEIAEQFAHRKRRFGS